MELSERCIAQLEKEGWHSVYEWQDKPGTVYPSHVHQGNVVLFVTEGSITVTVAGVTTEYLPGDRIDIPPNTLHEAVVGPCGAQYVVGEEIEGDS